MSESHKTGGRLEKENETQRGTICFKTLLWGKATQIMILFSCQSFNTRKPSKYLDIPIPKDNILVFYEYIKDDLRVSS